MELRKESRYRLDAAAVFSWEGGRCGRVHGEGITRDISVQGAFILTATIPPPDCAIQVELILPSVPGMKFAPRIRGKARVIRVQRLSADTCIHAFAVATDDLNRWGLAAVGDDSENTHAAAVNIS